LKAFVVGLVAYYSSMNIKTIVSEFSDRLSALIESQVMERARASVLSAFGVAPRRGPGRPPKALAAAATVGRKARKKPPRQLCPVPGCKNPAAPVFGMVCAKHKDLPKAKIKKFREARRAKKLGLPAPKARRRRVAKVAVQATPGASPPPS
jgi:hypothetical protein